MAIAHGVARYGLGDELYIAVTTMDTVPFTRFLKEWRERLRQTLRTDPEGRLGRRYTALASSVPDTFPDLDLLRAYIFPVTSAPGDHPLDSPDHGVPVFDLGALGQLCELYFSWGTHVGITLKFQRLIWPGVLVHLLMAETMNGMGLGVEFDVSKIFWCLSPPPDIGSEQTMHCVLEHARIGVARSTAGALEYRVRFQHGPMADCSLGSLRDLREVIPKIRRHKIRRDAALGKSFVWVPAYIVSDARMEQCHARRSVSGCCGHVPRLY